MNKYKIISLLLAWTLLAWTLLVVPFTTKAYAEELETEPTIASAPAETEETDPIEEITEETELEESTEEPVEAPEPTDSVENENALTEPEEYEEEIDITALFPDYHLNDYTDILYGSGTVADNGCSVCCLASVATYLTGHQYYPDELARWFGAKANNNVARLRYAADALHLPMKNAGNYLFVKEALREGKVVIQLMNRKSLFTNSQHFILLMGYNSAGRILVYDPSTSNREKWELQDGFANGFTEDQLCMGYDGAFIFDPAQMPEEPFVYEPPVRSYVEPRYTGVVLTDEETKLLAKLIYVEARGECEDGQQAIAEVVLNRYTSGLFGKSLSAIINDEDQFVPRKLLDEAKPGQAQYEAIDRALYGPYVLPKEVMFYGRVRTTDSVWGKIGRHIFCYENGYLATEQN